MRIFDTAARDVVDFHPRPGGVSIYVCGITPYDSSHLGHAFLYHVFDVLTRRLIDDGVSVRSVRNITDVDDDLLRVARERGIHFRRLADTQVARFDRDMAEINIHPVLAPRATEHIPEMVSWVNRLEEEGFAYAVDGWVYFDVAAFPQYGNLSGYDTATMIDLSRQRGADPDDPRKRNPLDFVLWQPSAPDEPSWPSFWGPGRPGWHIECTVLSSGALGTPIDIHGGGDDLIFPHHESELAQAEAVNATPFARHWLHVRAVHFQGEKMSKSLGNLVYVDELLAMVPPATVRLLLSGQHYREPWTYTEQLLHQAEARRRSYVDAIQAAGRLALEEAEQFRAAFIERMDDDLDTPGALRVCDLTAVALLHAAQHRADDAPIGAAELLGPMLTMLGADLSVLGVS